MRIIGNNRTRLTRQHPYQPTSTNHFIVTFSIDNAYEHANIDPTIDIIITKNGRQHTFRVF